MWVLWTAVLDHHPLVGNPGGVSPGSKSTLNRAAELHTGPVLVILWPWRICPPKSSCVPQLRVWEETLSEKCSNYALVVSSGAKPMHIHSSPFLGSEGSSRRNCTTNLYLCVFFFIFLLPSCLYFQLHNEIRCSRLWPKHRRARRRRLRRWICGKFGTVVVSFLIFFFFFFPLSLILNTRGHLVDGRLLDLKPVEQQAWLKYRFQNMAACCFRCFPKTLCLPIV